MGDALSMADTLAAQLTRVQAAIARIESGAQEMSIANRAKKEADLKRMQLRGPGIG